MKLAHCGHEGFIGSHLYAALCKMGRKPDTLAGHVRDDFTAHCLVEGCDVLYITGGVTGGAGLLKANPRALVHPNLKLHSLLFEACADVGCRKIICMGSTTGYPETTYPLREEDFHTDDVPACYFNPGHTRRFIERLAAMYPELEVTFLRTTNVIGPADNFDPETSHVTAATIRKVAEKQSPIVVWGDGSEQRDIIHVDDMTRALIAALDAPPGAYNIGRGSMASVNEILGLLCLAAKHEAEIRYDATKLTLLKYRAFDVSKAREVLKWRAEISLEDALARTLAWYLEHAEDE